jgi:hypothetical protein
MNTIELLYVLDSSQFRLEVLVVSFDIVSLFTQMPIQESLNLLSHILVETF